MSANEEVGNQVENGNPIVIDLSDGSKVDWSLVPPSLIWPSTLEAVTLATKAVMEDHKKNYQEALMLYKACEKRFLHAINHDAKLDKTKVAIRKKLKQYQDRAEVLTSYLERRDKLRELSTV